MPRITEKRRIIDWYLKSINAYIHQIKLVTLMETLEDMEDGFDTGSSGGGCGSVLSLDASSSSRFSSSTPPSSSMSTASGSWNSIKTTSSEMEDENLLQSIMVVNHLPPWRPWRHTSFS